MSVIRWEDPPPDGNRGRPNRPGRGKHWRDVARELRERPGRWGVVLEGENWGYAGGIGSQIKSGRLAAFRPSGSFEAQTRTLAGGYSVYARYVGEAES